MSRAYRPWPGGPNSGHAICIDAARRLSHIPPRQLPGPGATGDSVVDAILEVNARKERIRGMEIAEEQPFLRHFSARFRPL